MIRVARKRSQNVGVPAVNQRRSIDARKRRALAIPLGVVLGMVPAVAVHGAPAAAQVTRAANNGGHSPRWKAVAAPLSPSARKSTAAFLQSAQCPTAAKCVMVGNYETNGGNSQLGLLVNGGPSGWRSVKVPLPIRLPATGTVNLSSVSCPTASDCVVVGYYYDKTTWQGMILTGSGSSWHARTAPVPHGAASIPYSSLEAVTCSSASACVAVGEYQDKAGGQQGEILVRSGASWKAIKAPLPGGASAEPVASSLQAVTCPSASSCVIVGFYENTTGMTNALVIARSGKTWSPARLPQPRSGVTYPQAVACSSVSKCAMMAGNFLSPGQGVGILFTGAGTAWKRIKVPLPKGASTKATPNLTSLSCIPQAECLAVGTYGSASARVIAVSGTGSSWHATNLPLPSGIRATNVALQSVACARPSICAATGTYTTSPANTRPLIELTAGHRWAAVSATLPANADKASGISTLSADCASAKLCVAVGFYFTTTARTRPLILSGPA